MKNHIYAIATRKNTKLCNNRVLYKRKNIIENIHNDHSGDEVEQDALKDLNTKEELLHEFEQFQCSYVFSACITTPEDFQEFISDLVFNRATSMFQFTCSEGYEDTHLTYTNERKRFHIKKVTKWSTGMQYVFRFKDRVYKARYHGTLVVEFFKGLDLITVPVDSFYGQDLKKDLRDIMACKNHLLSLLSAKKKKWESATSKSGLKLRQSESENFHIE